MRRHRRGNTAVIVALCTVALFGSAALAIDLPFARLVQAQLQDVADAASHAATAQLDGTEAGLSLARDVARDIAGAHVVAGRPVSLADEDIVAGVYDKDAGTFTPTNDATAANAVRVAANRQDMGLFFAPLAFRRESISLAGRSSSAHETGPAGRADCFLPLALPACLVDRWSRDGLQDVRLQTNPAGIDNVGWASTSSAPNATGTRTQLADCRASGPARVGDPVYLQSGSVNNAYAEIADLMARSATRWSDDRWGPQPAKLTGSRLAAADYGKTLEGVVLVFDGGDGYCQGNGGAYNGDEPIAGFVWGAIYDVRTGGDRTIHMRLDVVNEHVAGKEGGLGLDMGLTGWRPPARIAER